MITATNLDNVERYAKEILALVRDVKRTARKVDTIDGPRTVFDEGKTTATLKRRSMDLTNALADLRSPNR